MQVPKWAGSVRVSNDCVYFFVAVLMKFLYSCTGNYYGAQCELDGEVLGVAIGASIAAVIIIGLTLVCLVMWR